MTLNLSLLAVALPILVITYTLIILDRYDRSILALLGAGAMMMAGVLHQEQAVAAIDFNTIGLLTGMMLLVAIARRSGLFEYLAIKAVQWARASPAGLLAALSLVTAVLSAFLDNVTTVVLIAPVTISICQRLSLPSYIFLATEVMASNFGGTATLIGDPPNILIGSAAELSFNDFLVHLTPCVIVVMCLQIAIVHLVYGRSMSTTRQAKSEIMAIPAAAAITDVRLMRYTLIVFAFALGGFCTTRITHQEPGTIALIAGVVLMLLENLRHSREEQLHRIHSTYGEVDWITIFFFVGLFIVVRGVQVTGAMDWIAHTITDATAGNRAVTISVILWTAAILSAIVDNIPFVAAMIPVIQAMGSHWGGDAGLLPLWVALSLGACFGGNGTLIGASANLTVSGIAQRAGIPFGFGRYTRTAAPLTLLAVLVAQLYLLWRYV